MPDYQDLVMGTNGETSILSVLPTDYWPPNGTTTIPNAGDGGTKSITQPAQVTVSAKSLTFDSSNVSNSPGGSYYHDGGGETINNPPDPSDRNRVAFAVWIEPDHDGDETLANRAIMLWHNGSQRGYVFGFFPGGSLIASGFSNQGLGESAGVAGPSLDRNSRHHIGFILDDVDGTIKLFLDGVKVGESPFMPVGTIGDGGDLYLGRGQAVKIGTNTLNSLNITFSGLVAWTSHQMFWRGATMPTEADFSALYAAGSGPVGADVTLTGLIADSEVRAYLGTDPTTATEIDGIESSGTSFTFTQSSAGQQGYIIVHKEDRVPIKIDLTYSANDQEIPIQQRIDRPYSNP